MVGLTESDEEALYPTVRLDNEKASHLMGKTVASYGHCEVAIVAPLSPDAPAEIRKRGIIRAMSERGIQIPKPRILECEKSTSSARMLARTVAQMENRPTAVICTHDILAIGLMAGLRDQGIAIPGQMSVVGFDDLPLADSCYPPLTTVRQPRDRIGSELVELLIRRVEGEASPVSNLTLDLPIVLRGTLARVPAA